MDVPTPIFPFASTVNIDTPVEDATLNGLSADEVDDCTLNAYVDDVALIPATTPLSRSVEVPTVVAVNQRVANPNVPPNTPLLVRPNVEVATHFVDVPVV